MALTKIIGAGAEGLTLSSTSLTIANGLTLTDGDVTLASGHGLNFAATGDSGGSMASELFHDYEEGSWTPTVPTATGYSNQTGRYTKIGRIVHLMFNIQTSSTSAATNELQGLPFASANTGQSNGAVSIGYYSNLSTSFTWISGYLPNNSSVVYFSGNSANNATIQHNSVNVFAGTSRILGTIIYQTAD